MTEVLEKSWLNDLQQSHLLAFEKNGWPTRKQEYWKYTDVSQLAKTDFSKGCKTAVSFESSFSITMVFINGVFSAELSDLSLLPKEITLCPLSEALNTQEIKNHFTQKMNSERHPFAHLNIASMTNGIFLRIPKNTNLSTPIHCVFLNSEQHQFKHSPHNILLAEENSQCTFIEEHVGNTAQHYFTNVMTTLDVKNNAQVHYYKIQNEHETAFHLANLFITQEQDSVVSCFNLSIGSALAREDVFVSMPKQGATCHLNGFYHLTKANQHVDHHLYVDHMASQGTSTMAYKGILDKKTRAVFNGKVYVHPGAQHINAQQANHNLLLSADAEINTKPELEIYADDVKCTHGATVGQLDAESLFYLQARGISQQQAVAMLTHAFADEVFAKIENPTIKTYIEAQAGLYDR